MLTSSFRLLGKLSPPPPMRKVDTNIVRHSFLSTEIAFFAYFKRRFQSGIAPLQPLHYV
jgi:hypothetical protein